MTDCSICLEVITDDLYTTVCGHNFHKSCTEQLKESGHQKCPMCRKVIFEAVPRFSSTHQFMIIASNFQRNFYIIPVIPQEDEELEQNRIIAERVIVLLFENEE